MVSLNWQKIFSQIFFLGEEKVVKHSSSVFSSAGVISTCPVTGTASTTAWSTRAASPAPRFTTDRTDRASASARRMRPTSNMVQHSPVPQVQI